MARLPRYFEGEERLEHWALARRTVRMGTPEALGVSDLARTQAHVAAGRFADAGAYIEYMHPSHVMMVEVTYEWCLRANAELERRRSAAETSRIRADAEEEWRKIGALGPKRPALAAMAERLSARFIDEHLAAELGRKRSKTLSIANPALTAELETLQERALAALRQGQREEAAAAVDCYYEHARACHDALIEYLWAFSAAMARQGGDELVDEVLSAAFRGVPAINMMWPALHVFGPAEAAFFLAEHLRGHFSGAGRQGGVEIIEEADRYRLVMDPCGSGGAVRRKLAGSELAGAGVGSTKTATAWGQTGVPFYCMHCAHNELRSIETVGFPRWVTEYDPDPNKPCGWTIYKNPDDIPDRYFERLGLRKDRSRFKRTGGTVGKLKALVGALSVMARAR
jgi:hypothetical protein